MEAWSVFSPQSMESLASLGQCSDREGSRGHHNACPCLPTVPTSAIPTSDTAAGIYRGMGPHEYELGTTLCLFTVFFSPVYLEFLGERIFLSSPEFLELN